MTGSPSDDEDRPRYGERLPAPQYGEYATPQDQARAIAGSLPPVSPALGGTSPAAPAVPLATSPAANAAKAARKPRPWDLVLTALLIGYGAVNVIAQITAGSSLSSVIEQFYTAQSIGVYKPTALAGTLGIALNIVTAVLFVATVIATAWMLRRGRIAFWVPLVGAAVASVVAVVFVGILLQADPTFTSYFTGLTR